MAAKSPVYNELNRKWKATCRILLGGEVGELDDFADWLYDYCGPRATHESSLSGKPVVSYDGRYSANAKWLSLDEVDFSSRQPLLTINQIKDIDSILSAIGEKIAYAGNIHLGNSSNIEDSTTVMDAHFIYKSESVWAAKYVAYTTHVLGECVFGGNCVSSNFLIRCNTLHTERSFEAVKCEFCSGIYFSHGLASCHDCMFSFNLRGKRNCIGNLQLGKEKYAQLKAKLAGEIREKLKKDKRLPHLFEMFAEQRPDYSPMKAVYAKMPAQKTQKQDKSVVESAFSETTKLILGIPYKGLDKYSAWLTRNTRGFEHGKSCASGKPILISDYSDFQRFPRDRLLPLDEAEFIGERLTLSGEEAEKLTMANAPQALSKIAYFSPEWKSGNNSNNIDCPMEIDCTDCYRSIITLFCKRCAFGWWPRQSEHIFGYNRTRLSAFCINTFDSEKIQRCFEVSEARSSTDCYYCHDIENCHECMFCFNAKNLKYAIGNVELPKEKYLEMKKKLLERLNDELSSTNSIALSIFNLPDENSGRKVGNP